MKNKQFKLGDVVEDLITGYKGVIVIYLQYLYNQDRYGVRSKELHDGKPIEPIFFDATSLRFIEGTDIKVPEFPEITVNLSDEVKDKVSAYKGTVIGYGYWINGCVRLSVQSNELNEEGHPVEEQWFPMDQMKVTKKGKEIPIKTDKKEKPGGFMKNPTSMKNPRY